MPPMRVGERYQGCATADSACSSRGFQGPHQTSQLLVGLRCGELRDHEAHPDGREERRAGPQEAAGLRGDVEDAGLDEDIDENRAATPESRPVQPAVPLIRFQNRPRMKIANSGALKKLASAWM